MIGMIRLFTLEILPPSLLGVKSRSCHDPLCFCRAKNVEAHDVVTASSAFGTRPAIVYYLQNNHRNSKSFNSNNTHVSKSNDLIHSQISLAGRYLFIKLAKWIKDQNSYNLEMISKTDCLMGFAFGKAQTNRSCFGFACGFSQMHPSSNTLNQRTKFSHKRNFPTWLSCDWICMHSHFIELHTQRNS